MPLTNADFSWFTDGPYLKGENGKYCAVYAIITPFDIVEATPLFFVQWLNPVQLFATLWTAACQASLSFTVSQSLLKHMSIESVIPSNHLILCSPLFLLSPIFPSNRVFALDGQSIGASASVLPGNIQG